jgi:uncharacterized peroxidase-related enzyme
MTYITTGVNQPGIVELLFYKGATGKALSNLAHTLLHGPSTLSSAERELIAAYVSKLNNCEYCHQSHSAAANVHFKDTGQIVDCAIENKDTAPISEKMKALLAIAGKVQQSGKAVWQEDIDLARTKGASDEELHDTVLIAAAFCMYNRYVDGLGTNLAAPHDYPEMGLRLAKKGYQYPPLFLRRAIVWMMNRKRNK